MKINILGVEIDKINLTEALAKIEKWIWNPGLDGSFHRGSPTNGIRREKHYVVTPNLEFILAAQKDEKFRKVLNNADLAIPDSSSIGFSHWFLKKSKLERLLLWPIFFTPAKFLIHFDRVTGTDLVDALCRLAAEKGFITGLLGGGDEVAKRCAECLIKKYPKLKVGFANSGGIVNSDGEWVRSKFVITPVDLLFVAFGHIKQEKWIANNLNKIPVKVAIGVGGAFDYLSGSVPRAPRWLQDLGLEWLFRLIVQPWRIKRQMVLIKYLWLLLLSSPHMRGSN